MVEDQENRTPDKTRLKQDVPAQSLPSVLPLFPLDGVLLLPGGQLPLNIFEPRYMAMVDDALASHRMIGMIQPNIIASVHHGVEGAMPALHRIGCAGRITEFVETPDKRYLITLSGVSRFSLEREIPSSADRLYRHASVDWDMFSHDTEHPHCLGLDREYLHNLLKSYFSKQDLDCDWDIVQQVSDNKLITCLSMICPLSALEKQALLEAPCCKTRGEMFIAMMEMAVSGTAPDRDTQH